jgi:hypothetical protein
MSPSWGGSDCRPRQQRRQHTTDTKASSSTAATARPATVQTWAKGDASTSDDCKRHRQARQRATGRGWGGGALLRRRRRLAGGNHQARQRLLSLKIAYFAEEQRLPRAQQPRRCRNPPGDIKTARLPAATITDLTAPRSAADSSPSRLAHGARPCGEPASLADPRPGCGSCRG